MHPTGTKTKSLLSAFCRSDAELPREINHLRNKRIEVVCAPSHEEFHGLGLGIFNLFQHHIAEIEQAGALGNNAHAHTRLNQRHDGVYLGQLLDVTGRGPSFGQQISHQVVKVIGFIRQI